MTKKIKSSKKRKKKKKDKKNKMQSSDEVNKSLRKGLKKGKKKKKKNNKILSVPKQKAHEAKKLRKHYKKQKCAFHNKDGKRCSNNAKGKSTLCKKHGGKVDVLDLIRKEDLDIAIAELTKYDPAVHPMKFIGLSKQGLTEIECAANFNISLQTLRKWSETYSDFAMAYDVGKVVQEAFYVAVGRDNFENTRFNTTLFKFITGNSFGWSDKTESRNINMNAHGVLVVPAKKGLEEWSEQAAVEQEEAQEQAEQVFKDALETEGMTVDAEFNEIT